MNQDETNERGWVWASTEESRAAGKVSILAITETLLCVIVYWVLLLYFGVRWHHWFILIAAPLMLLRSEQSIALGVIWFDRYWKANKIPLGSLRGVGIIALSALLAGLAFWFLAAIWLPGATGSVLFAKAAVIGWLGLTIGLAVAVAGARAGALPLAASLLLPGFFLGVWLRATLTRFAATARFLWPGIRTLPANWRFATIVSDIRHPAELIPGHDGFVFDASLYFSPYWQHWSPDPLRHRQHRIRKGAQLYVLGLIEIPFYFAPAIIWRWAIKSTAWFYIPLLWSRRGWQQLEGEELQIWAKSYSAKVVNWIWLLSGGLSFAAVTVTLFSFEKYLDLQSKVSAGGAPLTLLGFFVSLNWADLLYQPWLWFYLPSYALTIAIFFALDNIAKEIRAGAPPASRAASMRRWMWASNVRSALTNIGLAIALWYFLNAVDAWGQIKAFGARLLTG
ncbi:MAG: hypothetical protein AAGG56_14280 [Pseudomonadota bacterium]